MADFNFDDAVNKTLKVLHQSKIPAITGRTGADKSTEVVLVKGHTSTWPKLYAGRPEEYGQNGHNITTHGYIAQLLSKFTGSYVIVIYEFHEIDDDTKNRTPYEVTELPTHLHFESTVFHYFPSSIGRKCQVIIGRNDAIKEDTEVIFGTNVWNVGFTWNERQ
ncbi:30135_t:CDS:2 [Gigaspora margarita]|uniref:30135_t:CDS:1 n=1 Tax=Gigaspora margarita TaxID=4874 RepID=A0ABM8VX29_GIGMA|nr:30135_t:CDS:2 [Gigaspora margarita]